MCAPDQGFYGDSRAEDFPTLHLYSPEAHHCDAIIAGDETSLRKLKDAIETLLESGPQSTSMEAFTSDGEGYSLKVVVIPPHELNNMPLPYTADYAQERQDVGKPPYTYLYPQPSRKESLTGLPEGPK